MKLCPKCGAKLAEFSSGYMCNECNTGMYDEDEVIVPQCPYCNGELSELGDVYYCYSCGTSCNPDRAILSKSVSYDDFDEPDYDSMVNNGDRICLNCTYWSVSPYGKADGMYCRKGNGQTGPGDSCFEFVQSQHLASYGDDGQYQFDETSRDISNKLDNWRNGR